MATTAAVLLRCAKALACALLFGFRDVGVSGALRFLEA